MIIFRLTLCVTLIMGSTTVLARDLVLIPAQNLEAKWLRLSYSKIPPTEYKFSEAKLSIHVNKSASPLIYPFEKPAKLKNLRVKGVLLELPSMKPGKDDFVLRVGPAVEGPKQLNALQRIFAPKWITELDNLARSQGRKLGHLELSVVGQKSTPSNWKQRLHPDTDLIKEEVALEIDGIGPFELQRSYSESLPPSLGLWLESDGDNSDAQFSLRIDELMLQFYDDDK
ncbi:MAG: hypothetical protein AB7F66_11205 [Bacteriovoracia bacterium]